ncbi:MAG: FAD-dependent oxidoreductase [Spirochaetales bacterium]|nr:FAD-dependent oxidoreductase [Spirochaetales bacterium]
MNFDLLIIGGGPATITLVKKLGKKMNIGVIRPEDYSMIYCAMPYAVEGLLDKSKTFKNDNLITEEGAQLIRDYVDEVNFDKKELKTRTGKVLSYSKLVIASGAEPFIPQTKGIELEGVTVFKSQKDLEYVIKKSQEIKDAVVIGAGAIGIELAQALAKKSIKTHLVDLADSILANMVDREFSEIAKSELLKENINLILGQTVVEITGETKVEGIILKSGESLKADLVVFAIGMCPSISFLDNSKIKIARDGIEINEYMETSVKDVYAVGDCASYKSGITGKPIGGKLATNAVPMARVLADNLQGKRRPYPGFFNGAATKVGELYVGATGLKEETAKEQFQPIASTVEFTTAFPIMPSAKKVKLKLVADKNSRRILGGQIISGEPVTDKVDQITMAIQFGATIDNLLDFSYSSQPWQSYFPAHNLLVRAAELLLEKLENDNK